MKRTTADRARAASLALKLDSITAEFAKQRAMYEHIIVALDYHDYQLANYRVLAPLFGVKR